MNGIGNGSALSASCRNIAIQIFRLITVTHCIAPVSFTIDACMLQLAKDGREKFPKAAHVIQKWKYANDFYAGADSFDSIRLILKRLRFGINFFQF